MLEEVVLIKQNILDELNRLQQILTENGMKINIFSIISSIEAQLEPLKFYELKHKVDNKNIFFVFSENTTHEILAEINDIGFLTYYLSNGKGEIQKYNSLLQITQVLIHPLARQLQKQIQRQYTLLIDYDGDSITQVNSFNTVQPIRHEPVIYKQNDVDFNNKPVELNSEFTLRRQQPVDPSQPMQHSFFADEPSESISNNPMEEMNTLFALQKGSVAPTGKINPKFANLPADAFDADYTKD